MEKVFWKEVAAYLLTTEEHIKNCNINPSIIFNKLQQLGYEQLYNQLNRINRKNKAAKCLLEEYEHGGNSRCWVKRCVLLDSLYMGGGEEGTQYHDIAEGYNYKPIPRDMWSEIQKIPKNESDGSLKSFFKKNEIHPFLESIIVYQENNNLRFRIGDGYHRAVIACQENKKEILCYVGYNRKLTIAIDGPAGAGKSTVSKLLAKKLGYAYVDTGIMYRALAWAAVKQNIVPDQEELVTKLVSDCKLSFKPNGTQFSVFAGDEDITRQLRTPEMSHYSSVYSALPAVRHYLVKLQRELGQAGGVVMEGRDIGTVVFPEADFKFFLDASPEERGRRRFSELADGKNHIKLDTIIKQINQRDKQDTERKLAPLRRASDAVVIDSTRFTVDQVVEKMLQEIDRQHHR